MCNLYRMTRPASEVAAWFDVGDEAHGANVAAEVYPGYPAMVLAGGRLRAMAWGFPLVLRGKQGQPLKPRPVNNARSDKLQTGFWRASFTQQRCLIPLTAWAEAEGAKGRMTRTWMSVPDAPIMAAAGLWRESAEWGPCFAMVMTNSEGSPASEVHERMPVLLAREDYARWLDAPPPDALVLCKAWLGTLTIERTSQTWARRGDEQPTLL